MSWLPQVFRSSLILIIVICTERYRVFNVIIAAQYLRRRQVFWLVSFIWQNRRKNCGQTLSFCVQEFRHCRILLAKPGASNQWFQWAVSLRIFEWLSMLVLKIVGDSAQLKCLPRLPYVAIRFCNIAGSVLTSAGVPKLNNTYNSHLHRAIPRI